MACNVILRAYNIQLVYNEINSSVEVNNNFVNVDNNYENGWEFNVYTNNCYVMFMSSASCYEVICECVLSGENYLIRYWYRILLYSASIYFMSL